MKTFKISTKKRTELGKKTTQELRKEDNIPCVMYGGSENIHFYAHKNDFSKLIYSNEVFLIEIDIEGKKHNAVLKDIQFHPVSEDILHIDFVEVIDDKPTIVSLPVALTGTSVGILAGGKLRLKKRYLKAKGLAKDMPETLVIDITKLKIGDVIKVSDLKYPNLEILDPAQAMVVGIATSRLASTAGGATDEEEADEETSGEETSGEESSEAAAEAKE